MPARFTVLASGSSGNAAFLSVDGFGLLVDCGIGPRSLSDRLSAASAKWSNVSAVILTHTHGDHWKAATLLRMHRERIPIVLHSDHARYLAEESPEFQVLDKAGLVRTYREDQPFALTDRLRCRPICVPHDSDPTFAFRFDGSEEPGGRGWSLGYASDLGHVPEQLARAFRSLDLLALEFNHDVPMQRRSQRPRELVARVLGNHGHLSNEQAAEFVRSLLRDATVPLQALVQLHLSRECNIVELARAAAESTIGKKRAGPKILTARQDCPTVTLEIAPRARADQDRPTVARIGVTVQPALPGLG